MDFQGGIGIEDGASELYEFDGHFVAKFGFMKSGLYRFSSGNLARMIRSILVWKCIGNL